MKNKSLILSPYFVIVAAAAVAGLGYVVGKYIYMFFGA